ncbi:MAG TPA: hypothetical protein VM222_05765, partial [Planctomycetota bacterium]|nr:hypothetical protein [Planctomycetota bacterium]
GKQRLTLHAKGSRQDDAIRREVDVRPAGVREEAVVSGTLRGTQQAVAKLPAGTIPGTERVLLRVHPGTLSAALEGIEGVLRMPSGCFEQTLSSAYPNVALHAYLKETGQLTKDAEARLLQAHSISVQKMLSFENPQGGFGWYPGREANLLLSAYGTMFLGDLAKVYDYDRSVLDRTIAWLEKNQAPAGSWSGSDHGSTWSRLSNAAIPSTAYVAWALQRAGRGDSPSVGRAREFVARFDDDDGYAAALIANAFPTPRTLDQLARLAKDGHWTTKVQTWTRSRDGSADLEATALAVLALAHHAPKLADEAAGWIIRSRDPYGSWGSTQATVLALRALTATGAGNRDKVATKLSVNGKIIPNAFTESDEGQSFDVSPFVGKGTNEIVLETSRRVNAQISGRYYVPWSAEDILGRVPGLNLQVTYDRAELKVGEILTCSVKVEADAFAIMAEVAIPPGCTVDPSVLEDLVTRKVVDKVGQNGRTLIFYLPGKGSTFSFPLKPRYPMKVVVPRSVAYEYYTPDRRVVVPPQPLEVQAP